MGFSWRLRIFLVTVIALIVIGLSIWTAYSPPPLPLQSINELESGLFGSTYSSIDQNVTDGSGTYSFMFGLAYDNMISNNSATEVSVYCGLVNQSRTSFFTRGVAISLQSSSLSIDGHNVNGATVTSKIESGLQVFSFGMRRISGPFGNHVLIVKLFLSVIDVNYVGNSQGSYLPLTLNGTFQFLP